MSFLLEIKRFHAWVRLGVSPEERSVPQEVEFDVALRLSAPPRACRSDAAEDTVCYGRLCEEITCVIAAREFRLIEFLGSEVHRTLSEWVRRSLPDSAARVRLSVRVHKLRPPIDSLRGGVLFEVSDDDDFGTRLQ